MFSKDFIKDFDILTNEISKEPFAFVRYADGEHAVLERQPIQGHDWHMSPEYKIASEDINESLNYRHNRYFYGVSCYCCDPPKAEYFKNKLVDCWERVTYSNLFANANYIKTLEWLGKIDKPICVLGNLNMVSKKLPFKGSSVFYPSNIVQLYNSGYKEDIIAASITGTKIKDNVVLVALGPLSEILIHKMWLENPSNYYIDIGSVIDPFIHGLTRDYHRKDSPFSKKVCNNL